MFGDCAKDCACSFFAGTHHVRTAASIAPTSALSLTAVLVLVRLVLLSQVEVNRGGVAGAGEAGFDPDAIGERFRYISMLRTWTAVLNWCSVLSAIEERSGSLLRCGDDDGTSASRWESGKAELYHTPVTAAAVITVLVSSTTNACCGRGCSSAANGLGW